MKCAFSDKVISISHVVHVSMICNFVAGVGWIARVFQQKSRTKYLSASDLRIKIPICVWCNGDSAFEQFIKVGYGVFKVIHHDGRNWSDIEVRGGAF